MMGSSYLADSAVAVGITARDVRKPKKWCFRPLHEGDADRDPSTFATLDLPEEGLDLAFMHDWFVLNAGRGVLTEILEPRAVVLMHHRWERAEETRERVEQLPDDLASTLPPVTVFGAELENAVFRLCGRESGG
jgi:hypothetical protein